MESGAFCAPYWPHRREADFASRVRFDGQQVHVLFLVQEATKIDKSIGGTPLLRCGLSESCFQLLTGQPGLEVLGETWADLR